MPDVLTHPPPGWNGDDPTLFTSFPGYTHVVIANNGSNRIQVLDNGTDYYIDIDDYDLSNFEPVLIGGRNIVLIGGQIHAAALPVGANFVKGLTLRANVGIVHVEGVNFTGAYLGDNIVVLNNEGYSVAGTRIQVQNCRFVSQVAPGKLLSDSHPDIVQFQQAWPGSFWLDKCTGSMSFQGVATDVNTGPINLKRLNLHPITDTTGQQANAYLFQFDRANAVISLDDVWGESFVHATYGLLHIDQIMSPDSVSGRVGAPAGSDKAVRESDAISIYCRWPAGSNLNGIAREGVPAGGDFCAAGVPGVAYVSPGYMKGGRIPLLHAG